MSQQTEMPKEGAFYRELYYKDSGLAEETYFCWLEHQGEMKLCYKNDDGVIEVYNPSVEEALDICNNYNILYSVIGDASVEDVVDEEDTISITMTEEEYSKMISIFVRKHMRPESIGVFEDAAVDNIKDALYVAVINDVVNDIMEELVKDA